MTNRELLDLLEAYYDTAPRMRSTVEEHGPFSLFIARAGWPYYARPRLGLDGQVTVADVAAVLARQRELDVPQTLEWVQDTTPSLAAAAADAGMSVARCPLLVLAGEPVVRRSVAEVRQVTPDDPQLGAVWAAISVGFGQLDTAVGAGSVAEREVQQAKDPEGPHHVADPLRTGLSVLFGAFDAEAGAVGGGSHNPRDVEGVGVTELVGVAVLPAYRRRGIAAHLSGALARDALDGGVATVFCSAQDDAVARVYESVGFRRVGTACIAELP